MPELVAVVDLDRRIEIAFPVLDPRLQAQIHDILLVQLADTKRRQRAAPEMGDAS